MKIYYIAFVFFLLALSEARKRCFEVVDEPKCPAGQEYKLKGPGPFCYATCCGPRGPPCRLDTFTTGCFCPEGQIKVFPVANNSLAEPNNPCVSECDFSICEKAACTGATVEWRECGPTNMCDNQVCRGARPICPEEEAATCVAGCFCKPGFSRFNGECIAQCPLLP